MDLKHLQTQWDEWGKRGLRLVDASENRSAGPHWTSCTYSVLRP